MKKFFLRSLLPLLLVQRKASHYPSICAHHFISLLSHPCSKYNKHRLSSLSSLLKCSIPDTIPVNLFCIVQCNHVPPVEPGLYTELQLWHNQWLVKSTHHLPAIIIFAPANEGMPFTNLHTRTATFWDPWTGTSLLSSGFIIHYVCPPEVLHLTFNSCHCSTHFTNRSILCCIC